MRAAYEICSPSFSDMNIEQQIDAGINDWCAESDIDYHPYFGQSRDEAERNRCIGDSHRVPRGYRRVGNGEMVCNHK